MTPSHLLYSDCSVQFKKMHPNAKEPTYAHEDDAGADIYACETVVIPKGERALIDTGIAMHMNFLSGGVIMGRGYCRIAPKSGLALKGFDVAGGVVDRGYTGSIKVILVNNTGLDQVIEAGKAIAQLVFELSVKAEFYEQIDLPDTDRGAGGFGSTGGT